MTVAHTALGVVLAPLMLAIIGGLLFITTEKGLPGFEPLAATSMADWEARALAKKRRAACIPATKGLEP